MVVAQGDILMIEKQLWIMQGVLVDNSLVGEVNLRTNCRHEFKKSLPAGKHTGALMPETGAYWRYGKINSEYIYCYTNLPDNIKAKLPSYVELLSKAVRPFNPVENLIEKAVLGDYKVFIHKYTDLDKNNDIEAAKAAAIVHNAKEFVENHGISYNKSEFFTQLAGELKSLGIKYMPKTWRNLRDKIRDYSPESVTNIVKSKNLGNKNKVLKHADILHAWLVELQESGKNYSYAGMHRKMNLLCEQNELHAPCLRWVSGKASSAKMQYLTSGRYGDSRFGQNYRHYTPSKSAVYAGDCWQIDGTRVNIIDHTAIVMKDGKRMRSQKYLYIVAVRDVMSGLPLGWEYCYDEDANAVINALSMAVRNAGYLPYELVHDRFPGHNTQQWDWVSDNLVRMGVKVTVSHDPNVKGNIERWFGTLQDVFMSESDLYYGHGIKSSRRWAHRTKEYIAQMREWAKKSGFSFDDACRETDKILDAYCHTKYSSYSRKFAKIQQTPAQLHEQSDKPHTITLQEHEYLYIFGLLKQLSVRNYMLETQIDNAKYYYGIDDISIAENYTGVKLNCAFDYEDYSRVHLFDGVRYLGTFNMFNQAQRFGPDKDMRAVGIMNQIKEEHQKNKAQKLAELKAAIRELEEVDEDTGEVSEVALLQGGRLPKSVYEAAETAYLKQQFDDEDEEEDLVPVPVTRNSILKQL